jgi:hypothetical protein
LNGNLLSDFAESTEEFRLFAGRLISRIGSGGGTSAGTTIFPELTDSEVQLVADAVAAFFKN